MKTERRRGADSIDSGLSGALAAGLQPADLSLSQRTSLREKVLARVRDQAPEGTQTQRAHDGNWTAINDRVQIRVLRRDQARGDQTMLVRMMPGGVLDAHSHGQEEECFVIEGEIEIGDHCLRHGDMHIAPAGTEHRRILSRTGALLLVRGQISD